MDTMKVLNEPFNVATHKKCFCHYLEVIIDADGTVHYAVPSHREFMIRKACEQLVISREELFQKCPPEYYFDVINWLTLITDCVAVWENSFTGSLNKHQYDTLKYLESENLFTFPKKEQIYEIESLVKMFTGLEDISELGWEIYNANEEINITVNGRSDIIDGRLKFLKAAKVNYAYCKLQPDFSYKQQMFAARLLLDYCDLCSDIIKPEMLDALKAEATALLN